MLKLIAYLITAMTTWVAPETQAPLETAETARARYETIAKDIATVVLDAEVDPLFDGDDGRARTGLLLASIASHESRFHKQVDNGAIRGDHGAAWGIFQTHVYGRTTEGWSGPDIIADRTKAVRLALRMARQSFAACRGLELPDRLSVYTTGKCYRGQYESRVRVQRALGWLMEHPWRGCPANMVEVGDTCVDRYEAPNLRGAQPLAFQTAYDGAEWCGAAGRLVCEAICRVPLKRLCTDAEWTRACQGTAGVCNSSRPWLPVSWPLLATYPSARASAHAVSLYQAAPSGAHTECVSKAGAFDMLGNVAEWTTTPGGGYALKGCYWSGCFGGTPPTCAFSNRAHAGGFRSYEAGFRCCSSLP
jgi:hypothetical protein